MVTRARGAYLTPRLERLENKVGARASAHTQALADDLEPFNLPSRTKRCVPSNSIAAVIGSDQCRFFLTIPKVEILKFIPLIRRN